MEKADFWRRFNDIEEIESRVEDSPFQLVWPLLLEDQPSLDATQAQRFNEPNVFQWVAHARLPDLLSKLIYHSFMISDPTAMLEAALLSILESMGTTKDLDDDSLCKDLSLVLLLLIMACDRNVSTAKATNEAWKRVKATQGAPANPPKTKAQTKGGEKSKAATETHHRTFPQTSEASKPRDVILDILKDPPFAQMSQTHKDNKKYERPKCRQEHKEIVKGFQATVVGFYKGDDKFGRIRRDRPIQNIIYGSGPTQSVKQAIQSLTTLTSKIDEHFDYRLYDEGNLQLTWVHLPSTNVGHPWLRTRRVSLTNFLDGLDECKCWPNTFRQLHLQ
jgi:hypothetical protein